MWPIMDDEKYEKHKLAAVTAPHLLHHASDQTANRRPDKTKDNVVEQVWTQKLTVADTKAFHT
jgi:hypothetical protein